MRQQLAAFKARGNRPRILPADRAFWVVLRQVWARRADVLVIVRPDTVVRWHRAGFRAYWNCVSRRGSRRGRPPVDAEVRELIQRMALDNGWGAPRIHGELLMLGFDVSERPEASRRTMSPKLPELGGRYPLGTPTDGVVARDTEAWLGLLDGHERALPSAPIKGWPPRGGSSHPSIQGACTSS